MTRALIDDLFATIRENAGSAIWSKGVDMARQNAVSGESKNEEELILRVAAIDAGISRRVSLFPQDGDWTCDCNSKVDPCGHVCAAVIALKRAYEQGQDLPQAAQNAATLEYAFIRSSKGLLFERRVINPTQNTQELLTASLSAIAAGRIKGPDLSPTQDDLAVDMALEQERSNMLGMLSAATWRKLLVALKPFDDRGVLKLDGQRIHVSGEPIGLQAVVVDDGPGVRLFAEQDPGITENFGNGVALCEQTLRPVVLPALDPMQREILRTPRFYGQRELGELAGEILPRLKAVIKTDIRTAKLPGMTHAQVGIEIQLVEKTAQKLQITPKIIYHQRHEIIAAVQNGRVLPLGAAVPTRLPDEERRWRDQLNRELDLRDGDAFELQGEAAVQMVTRLSNWQRRSQNHFLTGTGVAAFSRAGALQPEVQFTGDDIMVSFAAPGQQIATSIDPLQVLSAWRRGETMVQITSSARSEASSGLMQSLGWASLPLDWLQKFGPIIESLLIAKAMNAGDNQEIGILPASLIPTAVGLADAMQAQVDIGMQRFAKAIETLGEVDDKQETDEHKVAPLLQRLQAHLRPYQQAGVRWLASLKSLGLGGVLADDMGLGKTIQTLAILNGPTENKQGKTSKTLVVAPTSVLPNWAREAARFRPDLRVHIYHGSDRELKNDDADLVLTTYALLRRDLKQLQTVNWSLVVLDEAQTIKNPDSQVSRAAYELKAAMRLCLSGTPVENRLDDAWSLFHFACPGLLGTRQHFNEFISKPMTAGDPVVAASLRERLKPFLLRRLKSSVAVDLPPRTDMVLYAELNLEERTRYEAIKAATRAEVMEKLAAGGSVMHALEALLRLRQAATHQGLLPQVENEQHLSAATSSKVAVLIEKLEEATAEGHKALVFSQWTGLLDLLEPALQASGLKFLRLDGATSNRGDVVERFQGGEAPVLIMSLKAGGVGLNLTAADHVFMLDPWWNPAVEDQAADRAHRIGQDKPVMVYKLIATDTVEERILALQDRKRALAASVIGSDPTSLAGHESAAITRDDLLALLA